MEENQELQNQESQQNTENNDFGKVGIGTRESETLEAKPVTIQGHKVEDVYNKDKNHVGKKVVLLSKHPERDEILELSKTKYLKGEKVNLSGLWLNLDKDGNIAKQSALAQTMTKFEANVLDDLVGKQIPTDKDQNGYLAVKAY